MNSTFIPGLELSRRFYADAVRPILDREFPDLPHAAAQIGTGSDILGFDTAVSMDHDWSPAVTLYLREEDWTKHARRITQVMGEQLPFEFMGFPVHMAPLAGEQDGTFVMTRSAQRPINHSVWPVTIRRVFQHHMIWDPSHPLTPVDWLTIPSQLWRGFTAGAVYYDSIGDLTRLRQEIAFYPHDVWLYLLAAAWLRIEAAEPLVGRTGAIGDELGSSLLGARLSRDVMSLCFLMEKQYAPYAKWFGSAFQQLRCAAELTPLLLQVQHSVQWKDREAALVEVYRIIARLHNALGLTDPLPEEPSIFSDTRPYQVIHGDRFAAALLERITDDRLKPLLQRSIIGSVDQWVDHDDLRMMIADWRGRLMQVYAE